MIDQITAGDTLTFLTAGGEYQASAGWSLVYRIIPRTAGTVISFTSSAEGDDHRVTVAAATTAAWASGSYSWSCYATKAGERYTLQTGSTVIVPDPGIVTTLDNRTSARKALDSVNALMETYGSKAYLQAYDIAGRGQKFHTPGDFLAYRSKLQAEVAREENADRLRRGLSPRNQIHTRFTTR